MMPGRTLGTPEGLTFETIERDGKPVINVVSGPAQARALRGMRHAVAAMAGQGCNMVIDEVLFSDEAWNEYHALLKPYAFRTVGVFAPLDVLEVREKARGDRAIGLARGQYDVVHRGRHYDFVVDTAGATAEDCARAIVEQFGL
jgi:chloramphenicol 3-O phosphotransferase